MAFPASLKKMMFILDEMILEFYNLGHNIFELYNVLVQIQLTTSKTKRDTYYSKLSIRVVSRVAKQLKT